MSNTLVAKSKRLAPSSRESSAGERVGNQLLRRQTLTLISLATPRSTLIWSKRVSSRKMSWHSGWICAHIRIQRSLMRKILGAYQALRLFRQLTSTWRLNHLFNLLTRALRQSSRTGLQRKMQAPLCTWSGATMSTRMSVGCVILEAIVTLSSLPLPSPRKSL